MPQLWSSPPRTPGPILSCVCLAVYNFTPNCCFNTYFPVSPIVPGFFFQSSSNFSFLGTTNCTSASMQRGGILQAHTCNKDTPTVFLILGQRVICSRDSKCHCSAATFQNAAKTKLESSLDVQTRIQFGRPN